MVDEVMAVVERQAETTAPVATEITTSLVVSVEDLSEATVEDCVLMCSSIIAYKGVWYEAELEAGGFGLDGGLAPDQGGPLAVSHGNGCRSDGY